MNAEVAVVSFVLYLRLASGTDHGRVLAAQTSIIDTYDGFVAPKGHRLYRGNQADWLLANRDRRADQPCIPTAEDSWDDAVDNDCDGKVDEELCTVDVVNVALGKPTEQSSTNGASCNRGYHTRSGGAVDGFIGNQDVYEHSCFHTNSEYQPWWNVDLGSNGYLIETVTIYNRQDGGYAYRASNIKLSVGNSLCNLTEVGYLSGTLGISHTYTLSPPVFGRFVLLQMIEKTEYFHLCEVEVYAKYDDDGDGQADEDCTDGHTTSTSTSTTLSTTSTLSSTTTMTTATTSTMTTATTSTVYDNERSVVFVSGEDSKITLTMVMSSVGTAGVVIMVALIVGVICCYKCRNRAKLTEQGFEIKREPLQSGNTNTRSSTNNTNPVTTVEERHYASTCDCVIDETYEQLGKNYVDTKYIGLARNKIGTNPPTGETKE